MKTKFRIINFSLVELTIRSFTGGGIAINRAYMLFIYYLKGVLGLPFAFLQFLFYSDKIKKTVIEKNPVFILGHYRSGTTYLHKLMASDNRFGFLTNYDAQFPNSSIFLGNKAQRFVQSIINLFKIKNPFFNNTIVELSEPTEEDDYLINKGSPFSAYWGLIFPARWREWLNCSMQFNNSAYYNGWKKEYMHTLKLITYKSKQKQLVLKSPPNTERVRYLLEMFPNAKFIYIYRNPFHLFYSMKNMWKNVIKKYYSVQRVSEEQMDEIIFEHFDYLTQQYEKDKKLIPPANLIEIRYEELEENPFEVIKTIYVSAGLPDFNKTSSRLLVRLKVEKKYQKFQYQFSEDTFKKIETRWNKYIEQWKYKAVESAFKRIC